MGVMVSSSHVSAALSSSGGGLLTLCPCSSVRFLSQETVLHKLLQRESFPRAAVLHELPQCGSVPTGCSPSGAGCSSVGPPRGHKPCQQTCSGVGSSLHGSGSPGRSLLQRGLPVGSQLPSGIHLLRRGVPSMGCRLISAPPWTSVGCRGTACLTAVFYHELQGQALCSSISSTSSPSFFTDVGVCRVVSFTSSHSSLFTAVSLQFFFLPLLKYVITEVLPPSLMGLALASRWVHLRASWHWLYQTWGKLLAASHRIHPYSPPATKALPRKAITWRE